MENWKIGKLVSENELGKVRIVGKVTPEKLALAQDFHNIFEQATQEIENLAEYVPNPVVLDLVKSQKFSREEIKVMIEAKPWMAFKVGDAVVIKTPDNKLEYVADYCYRLEKAVLTQVNLRKQSEEKSNNSVKFLQEQLANSEKKIDAIKRAFDEFRAAPNDAGPSTLGAIFSGLALKCSDSFGNLKSIILKHLGE